jgi:two-component system, cell cycle sensor histidine kinase and response regulator CckA
MFEDAFTQADYAINITDPEGRLLRVNLAYLKLYKFTSESEVLGKTQRIIRSPMTPGSLYQDMWQNISQGRPWRGDLINKARDGGDVHVHITISPIRHADKIVGYMGFSLDREQQVMLERQLLHANKLMMLGTLGAGLAHEMNNPLASILLDAEYLQEIHSQPGPALDYSAALAAAESVIRGVERMRRVLKHLLQYSKKDVFSEAGNISVRELVEDSFLFVNRQLINRGIQLRQEVPEAISIPGIRTQLESVLHNLISNSCDAFLGKDGDGKYIAISSRRNPHGQVEIIFEDNAGGIPAGHLGHIFEPFFTTKEGQMGTGLGLSLSRKIISDHGGSIQCESSGGRTRFTILLPTEPASRNFTRPA